MQTQVFSLLLVLLSTSPLLADSVGDHSGTWKGTTADVDVEFVVKEDKIESVSLAVRYITGKACSGGSIVVHKGSSLQDKVTLKFNPGYLPAIVDGAFHFDATDEIKMGGHFLSSTEVEGAVEVKCAERPLEWKAAWKELKLEEPKPTKKRAKK